MTLQQLEKTRETIQNLTSLKDNPMPKEINKIDSALENFFHKLYKSHYFNMSNYFMYDDLYRTN